MYLPEEQSDADDTRRAVEADGTEALLLPGDIRDPDFCQKSVEQTIERFGHLDILVNNAAYQQHQDSLEDITFEQWDRTFKTNIYSYFYLAKAAIPYLNKGAAIINTGSIVGIEGRKGLLDYGATKGAIHSFTKSLTQNLVDRGIRVNCVAPGRYEGIGCGLAAPATAKKPRHPTVDAFGQSSWSCFNRVIAA